MLLDLTQNIFYCKFPRGKYYYNYSMRCFIGTGPGCILLELVHYLFYYSYPRLYFTGPRPSRTSCDVFVWMNGIIVVDGVCVCVCLIPLKVVEYILDRNACLLPAYFAVTEIRKLYPEGQLSHWVWDAHLKPSRCWSLINLYMLLRCLFPSSSC